MGEFVRDERKGELSPGALFADRYQIEDVLGRGGMGTVYRACDLSLGEPIALKLLAFGPEPPPVAVLRFRQEVKLARRVTHPNVARVYDIGEHDGHIFLTMELVTGGTLRALLQRERHLGPRRALAIARALTDGLCAAHSAGVIHRDLKPTNVLIDRAGRVVLTDFGIARSLQEELSLTMGAVGTPDYMAPEQAYGEPVDARADIYALGRILLEMLTGERSGTSREMLTERLARHEVPDAIATLALRCIEREPGARPHSASEVARALAKIAADTGDDGVVELSAPQPPDPREVQTVPADATVRMPLLFPEPGADASSCALAVLPFLYRGGKETDYLGDVIADELVDVLSRTRIFRVLGTGSTARYRSERDPRALGRALGVSAVIDGTVLLLGPRVRITVRLVDAASGAQRWSERHEGPLEDLFAFQEAIAQRVAEELRVELTTMAFQGGAPAEAIEHYLAGRSKQKSLDPAALSAAAASFERCIELAPEFTPALAAHAVASLRAWFFGDAHERGLSWAEVAMASVIRARHRAPELAETHLAAGMYASHCGAYAAAVRSLTRALTLAPTCAEAHEYLGIVECEGGQSERGTKRLKLALDLNPDLTYARNHLAFAHELHERHEEAEAVLVAMERRGASERATAALLRVRFAAWRGDRTSLLQIAADATQSRFIAWQAGQLYAAAVLGSLDTGEIEQRIALLTELAPNDRRRTYAAQLAAELFARRGELDRSIDYIVRAADLLLIEIDWLDRCPLFAPLRSLPRFVEAREQVKASAEAIWLP